MKNVLRVMAVAVLFIAATSFAANYDGTYTFKSRTKEGKPDLAGWTGAMKIENNTTLMDRNFKSADGSEIKFYVSTLTNEGGDTYNCKFTKAYKPEYVGMENKNKITLTDTDLTMASTDGKFIEVWTKK